MKKLRALLSAALMIMLSVSIAVAGTFALFSDKVEVTNHLHAGTLKVELDRTHLTVKSLNGDGEMEVIDRDESANPVSFTNPTEKEIFESKDKLVAASSYFEATMRVKNAGTIALVYSVKIKLTSVSNALAEKLNVWVQIGDGAYENKGTLSQFANENYVISKGNQVKKNGVESFKVKIELPDDVSDKDVQGSEAVFDLIVLAEQYVPAETTV